VRITQRYFSVGPSVGLSVGALVGTTVGRQVVSSLMITLWKMLPGVTPPSAKSCQSKSVFKGG